MGRRSGRIVRSLLVGGLVAGAATAATPPDPCAFPLPAPSKVGGTAFDDAIAAFLNGRCYETLGWTKDRERRDTGPWIEGSNYGTHPAVRIYYSPEVMRWLEGGRKGAIDDGGLIVKEMFDPPAVKANPLSGWTYMARDSAGSFDGWYWGFAAPSSDEAPAAGAAASDTPAAPADDISYPDAGFGLYCLNCHASADDEESTYVAERNIDGAPITYLRVDPTMPDPRGATESSHRRKAEDEPELLAAHHRRVPDPEFLKLYDEMPEVPLASVVPFPGEALDDVDAAPRGQKRNMFLTSSQCIACHDATQSNAAPPNMIVPADATPDDATVNLSPYGEWRASMMGLAGRDPIFYAQLESELHIQPEHRARIQNTCFHCHGVMGQRQLEIDHGGKRGFEQRMVFARPGQPDARYGALARDGVSCTACHHVAAEGLGTPATFTGDFKLGPADVLFGPYPDVATLPMERALGVTPRHGAQVQSSALCGSCHAIKLPVFDAQGREVKQAFEQTTYLEWLNSDFQNELEPKGETPQTCQGCHMPVEYDGQKLRFRVANIEDDTFPYVDNRAPDADITVAPREPFARHTLVGINLFGLEIFRQFPELLGIRKTDPMATYGDPAPGLATSAASAVELATEETATLAIRAVERQGGGGLAVKVEVANLAGHHFPSGVGFRRAFLTLEALDAQGAVVWASGRASRLGVLLGPDGKPLPTEFFAVVDGKQVFQPHHQTIDREDQVQIYEELIYDCEGTLTTSFIEICSHAKDNRLQPRGWRKKGPFAEETRPWGAAERDCDYRFQKDCPGPSAGVDRLTYRLPAAAAARATSVRVALSYQAIPPYYLKERFTQAKGDDGKRLYAMTSYLRTEGTPIAGWRVAVASVEAPVPGGR